MPSSSKYSSLFQTFQTKFLFTSMRATCCAHRLFLIWPLGNVRKECEYWCLTSVVTSYVIYPSNFLSISLSNTYLLTPLNRPHIVKVTGSQLVKKFPEIYGTRRFIHKYPPRVPIQRQLDPVHTATSHLLNIHLNIILPSTPGSPKWSLSLRFPHLNPVYNSPIPHTR